ncbi:Zinc finger CCCH domain-containing protein 21 [Glycine soja]
MILILFIYLFPLLKLSFKRNNVLAIMEDWDQETVNKVVESKKTEHNQNKPTDIEKKEDKTSTPTQTMVVMTWILYATYRSDFEVSTGHHVATYNHDVVLACTDGVVV